MVTAFIRSVTLTNFHRRAVSIHAVPILEDNIMVDPYVIL